MKNLPTRESTDHGLNVSGEGGIGKSSTMAYLALNWASGDDEVLKQFDLLFYIKLSEVTGKDKTIEEIITEQHEELCGMEEQLTSSLLGVKWKIPGKLGILALHVGGNGLRKHFFHNIGVKIIHNTKTCIHMGFDIITSLFEIISQS